MVTPALRELFAAAYLAALNPPVLPVSDLPHRVRLDDTGRPPHTPLRGTGGDRGR